MTWNAVISAKGSHRGWLAITVLAIVTITVTGCGGSGAATQAAETGHAEEAEALAQPQGGPMARFVDSLGVTGNAQNPRGRAAAPPPQPVIVQVPAGTPIRVRTTSTLSTRSAQPGQEFVAHLAEPIVVDGREIAPRGTEVVGRVVDSDPGGRVKGVASISLALARMPVANGDVVNLETSRVVRDAPTTRKRDATKIGIGAGSGAVIGAIAGGGKGAAIGSAVGGGAGTGVVLATRGDPAVVSAESLLTFNTRAPIQVQF
jgi:hypothetical protein